ncbi:F-box domain [Macleaya cordata]|uniref:F-box domain n=1 Tax=Macleaya cordata TaxID=56857 RepID=A0A200PSI4_MACCD|nr:F-box domain [Macleaya cordata]
MDLENGSSSTCNSKSKSSHESKVFEFWKTAKDGIAINLCEKNGLLSPPCFTFLHTDLKLKILEFLPGVDVARIGCVSSEFKYLSSNNDLWRKKRPGEV